MSRRDERKVNLSEYFELALAKCRIKGKGANYVEELEQRLFTRYMNGSSAQSPGFNLKDAICERLTNGAKRLERNPNEFVDYLFVHSETPED